MNQSDHDDADRLVLAAIRLTRTLQCLGGEGSLSAAQSGALIVIVHAGRIVARDLARHQRVTAATMSRLLDQLEKKKLILREADAGDNRLWWIRATPAGAALIAREHRARLAPLSQQMRRRSAAERKCLIEAAALMEAMTADLAKRTR